MEIPYARWYPAIATRRSRRQYDPSKHLSPETIYLLKKVCLGFRPFPGVRAELVIEPPDRVFRGWLGSYGKVAGAQAYLAFIGNADSPTLPETVGYTGEGAILEANALGLTTCWMSLSFRPKVAGESVQIGADERVLAVSPVGYPNESMHFDERVTTGFGRAHLRQPLPELASGLDAKTPEWITTALEAARLAPSAYNRQPWRFQVDANSIIVSADEKCGDRGTSKRLDCGIAMLHIEVAALEKGKRGKWELLSAPKVARFQV